MRAGNSGWGKGAVWVNREEEFELLDILPAPVRDALNDSVFNYSVAETMAKLACNPVEAIPPYLAAADALLISKNPLVAA